LRYRARRTQIGLRVHQGCTPKTRPWADEIRASIGHPLVTMHIPLRPLNSAVARRVGEQGAGIPSSQPASQPTGLSRPTGRRVPTAQRDLVIASLLARSDDAGPSDDR
jgi:hypothetical protein